MLCKCRWIMLYTVHFTAFSLGGRFFSGYGVHLWKFSEQYVQVDLFCVTSLLSAGRLEQSPLTSAPSLLISGHRRHSELTFSCRPSSNFVIQAALKMSLMMMLT